MTGIELAVVTRVTRITHYDAARTEADVVRLSYGGRLYFWETEPGLYGAGQKVSVNPPATPGANITWKGGEPS
jgi:hypothetical protein